MLLLFDGTKLRAAHISIFIFFLRQVSLLSIAVVSEDAIA
jgi:hypothetical protein